MTDTPVARTDETNDDGEPLRHPINIHQLRELTALQAMDESLWSTGTVGEAYIQQGLRYLTRAIEGEWSFEHARAAIKEMQP